MTSETRVQRPRRAAPADAVRPTRAEINLEALRHNLRVVERHAHGAKVWAVLKADGYGHGAPAVARTLERAGAPGFCVALVEEAIELREAGITVPILVMSGFYGGAYEEVIARKLTPVIYHKGDLEGFARLVRAHHTAGPIDVHVKVDTGMSRLGVTPRDLPAFAESLQDVPELRVSGLMTHLACADAATVESMQEQTVHFDEATALLARYGVRPQIRHAANSAAVLRGHALLDVVRPGAAIFGLAPRLPNGDALSSELRPVMRVRTQVVAIRELPAGASVGYGSLFQTSRESRIATLPMGYADGLSRQLTNCGQALVRGKRVPMVGAVSMDMTMVDVTDAEGAQVGDEVVVLGAQEGPLGEDCITSDEVAKHAGTIAWEVLTSISRRVPRFYREP